MEKRYVAIWFRHLRTDWFSLRRPELKKLPFVLRTPMHGRMVISAANAIAVQKGIPVGMVLADARAIQPDLQVSDDNPELAGKLLARLAAWCIRFTPVVAVDLPDGLILDASGCTHLWCGDDAYVGEIAKKITARGYEVNVAIADTSVAAWGVARYGRKPVTVLTSEMHTEAVMALPPEGLRLEEETVDRLHKLGLHHVRQFAQMPRAALRKRFGNEILHQLDKAFGQEMETLQPVCPPEPYQERLPSLEPITTATGIEIALRQLLETLCLKLQQDQKGLRTAVFKGYRVDGKTEQVAIATSSPSHHVDHLFKLFELKIPSMEPALGIELFMLEAPRVEDCIPKQEKMWQGISCLEDVRLAELVDRLTGRVGIQAVHRYLPAEHYWPERSYRITHSLQEKSEATWRSDKARPLYLLPLPERIEVMAPIPDYPPMLFRHDQKLHKVVRADGPERIEQEWWLQPGQHRDYYAVEDEEGHRYWVFRLGHYHDETNQWFLHGFFA